MADYENETLEETQRRLANLASSAASPWVNRPSTAVAAPPSAPPVPLPVRPPVDRDAAAPAPEIPTPPPYVGARALPTPGVPSATPPAFSGRRRILVPVAIAGTLAVLGVAIAVGVAGTAVRPIVDPIWIEYPGNAYADPAVVLASDSKEAVVADAEAFLGTYREELTAELGIVWDQTWEGSLDYGSNYYDGESMLWDYSSGEWQGSVRLTDPGARERVARIFERLTAEFGASDYRFNNAIYSDDAAQSEEQFGAAELADQAVWSFTGSGDESRSQFRIASRAWDRSLPTDDTFTGDVWFNPEQAGSDTFVITVSLWSNDLLAESDRAEFIERLQPYEDLERPDPN